MVKISYQSKPLTTSLLSLKEKHTFQWKKATEKQISSNTPIKPNKEGPIDTFKVGNVTYIPLNVVPKKFTPLFKKKIPVTPTTPTVSRPNNATHVINVNG